MNFFGLTPADKNKIHEELFILAYGSSGGLPISDLYNMPVYLRRFYALKLREIKELERKQAESGKKTSSSTISRPGIVPKTPPYKNK